MNSQGKGVEQENNINYPSTSGDTSAEEESNAGEDGRNPMVGNNKNLKSKLERLKEKYEMRGIVYISRLPPRLKPQKLRHMLERYATIGRIYLTPEDPLVRKKRKKSGGNSGKNFTEGWVEFEDKTDAKRVAAMLNGQQMGGKRRSAHYYDLWNIKYLPKFKWDHLTEEINYQKAIKEQKLAAEIAAAKRERDFYLSRVDKAKAVKAMAERRQKGKEGEAAAAAAAAAAADDDDDDDVPQPLQRLPIRKYMQRKSKPDSAKDSDAPVLSNGFLKLLAGEKADG